MIGSSGHYPSIVMLTQRFPYPPNRGDRIRSYNLLRYLSERFNVCFGCISDEPVPEADLRHVEQLCHRLYVGRTNKVSKLTNGIGSALCGHSITEGFFYHRPLARTVQKWHGELNFQLAFAFCSSMYQYVEGLNTKHLVDLVDVDSRKWEQMSQSHGGFFRWLYAFEARRVKRLENRLTHQAAKVLLVSPLEAQLFRDRLRDERASAQDIDKVVAIGNGVDTTYFHTSDLPPPNAANIVFTGVLNYPPNAEGITWFCQEVLPRLASHLKRSCQLFIVGKNPTEQIKKLGNIEGVKVIGEVPDVRPFLQAADIAISPLHLARGIQNKVLEAMACGLPVVLTPASAEGIEAIDQHHFRIAHSASDFAVAVAQLLVDENQRKLMGIAARELVVNQYSWAARLEPLNELIEELVPAN